MTIMIPVLTASIMSQYKRDYPRTAAELLVRIQLRDGPMIHATTANLSRAGFQVAADPQTVGLLFPVTPTPNPRQRVEVEAELHLPGGQGDSRVVNTRSAAVFARRIAAAQYRVGFQFTDIEPEVEAVLGAFVDGR